MRELAGFELFGLLHIARNQAAAMNLKVRSFDQGLSVYLANAVTLHQSLKLQGASFTLLTNDSAAIENLYAASPALPRLPVRELPFSREVPRDIRFFSAHYKLDVYKYFSTLDASSYVGLLDLDMIAANPLPASLATIITNRVPACYDITDQVLSAVGRSTLMRDMARFTLVEPEGRWIGGECLMGPPAFFAALSHRVDELFPSYASCFEELHHQGDEMLVSAALEDLRRSGTNLYIAELGSLGVVARYWNAPINHGQKAFRWHANAFLLHLPADKRFLAELAALKAFDRTSFMRRYRNRRWLRAPLYLLKLIKLRGRRYIDASVHD